ncbi:glycoside hydrolase family 28 protein [Terriglobus sp.]|uniref:glycoside hydrolase family 28 protein n=1 Tax=Terriglobus sp. TaxID=1889013 RepID=UPI003B0000CF
MLLSIFLLLLTLPAQSQNQDQNRDQTSWNLRSFHAAGDGRTSDTAALQKAIDQVSREHGMLVVPAGVYVIGTVELRSHMTLLLEHGAVLQGSPRMADYGTIAQYGLDRRYGISSSGEGDRVGMLIARDAEDIRITGDGAIDGLGKSFFDPATPHAGLDFDPSRTRSPDAFVKDIHRTDDGPLEVRSSGRPGTMLQFHHVRNVTIEGVTLRDAPNWTLHLQHAQHVTIHALRIDSDPRLPNNDAMDCMDCHDLRVSDSSFTAGDDDFAIVGSSDVAITNCTLESNSAAIRYENSSDAVFSNLVIRSNRGIAIFAREGTYTRNALFQNIVIETRLKHGHWWGKGEPIYIASSIRPGDPAVEAQRGQGESGTHPANVPAPAFIEAMSMASTVGGVVENLRFSDILADADAGILLEATHPGAVRDITLRNVRLRMHAPAPELAASEGGNFDLRWTANTVADGIVRHDIPAVYAHNIDTLTVDGLEVSWPLPMVHVYTGPGSVPPPKRSNDLDDPYSRNPWPAYFTGAVEVHGFQSVSLDRIHAGSRPDSTVAVVTLDDGNTATLRDSESTTAGQPLLRVTGMRTPVFTSGNRPDTVLAKRARH